MSHFESRAADARPRFARSTTSPVHPLTRRAASASATAAIAALLAATGVARADDLDVIVVTASRYRENLRDVPQSVSVLDRAAIERQAARTPNQMLREMPGIWTTEVNSQGSPIIRGQIGNRVLYLWNGVRINNGALFSGPNGYFNQFPLDSVERMEVLRGPAAVQYGSDAIGGVVNVIGRDANPFAAPAGVHFGVGMRYGSVDSQRAATGDASFVGDRTAVTFGLVDQAVGDYDAPGVGRQANTGFDETGGHFAVGVRVGERQTLRIGVLGGKRTDVDTYSQSKLNASGVPRIFSPYERRWIAKADYTIEDLGAWSRQLDVYAYYQTYAQQRLNTNESGTALAVTTTDTDQDIRGFGLQNTTRLGDATLTLGADARFESLAAFRYLDTTVKSTRATTRTIPNGNVPDGSYRVYDLFALATVPITRAFDVRAGVRAERTRIDSRPEAADALAPFTIADLLLDETWNSVTWSAGALYRIDEAWSLAATVATGFRAPTYSDTLSTGVPVFASGIASVPSPGVGPEKTRSYEVSLRRAGGALDGALTVYRTNLLDLMTARPVGTIVVPGVGTVVARANTNSARGYVQGAEFYADWRFAERWSTYATATWTYGQDTTQGVPLRFIPPVNGLLALRHESAGRAWWAEGTLRAVARMRRHAPQDEIDAGFSTDPGFGSSNSTTNPPYRPGFDLPGYAVVGLRGGWQHANGNGGRTAITLNLHNLFDVRYREAYSQQQLAAPGFGAVLSFDVSF